MEFTLTDTSNLLLQILMGASLAACAGLRAFLPPFLVGLAGRLDWVPLLDSFEWLESTPALVVFGCAVVLEIAADKIPMVDHLLDTLEVWIKPVAGAFVAASVLTELTPLQAMVLGVVGGGVTAGVFHVAKANVRLASSFTTLGFANPIVSLAEDVIAVVGVVLALFVPLLAGTALILLLFAGWMLLSRARRARHRPVVEAAR